jgi:DNA-binding Lrp family transcriptional regulator
MTNDSEYEQLDDLDRMILAELSLDGRMSVTELAKKWISAMWHS